MLGPSKVRHIFYFCAKGAISNTMLKHQGASRTAGTHMAGDGYVAAIAKRLGEDRFFSEAFGVFTTYLLFFVYFVWRYSEFSYICKRQGDIDIYN